MIAVCSLKKRGHIVVRRIPVPAEFAARLGRFADHQEQRLWPWGRTKAWQVIKEVMEVADIHGSQACPKALRHTFGVHAIQNGVPIHLVQRWLGHSQISTTAIYLDVIGEEERAIAAKMWQ